jgi:PAS domain S-box-containing protein
MTPQPTILPGFEDVTVFRTLFAAYPDALLVVDAQGVVVLANPAAVALLGYAAHELLGLGVDALVPDAIRPRHAAYRDAYGRNPRARPMGAQMELVARRRDGSEVMVEIALSPLQDHGLPYVVAAIRGIGAYPRVKQALQRARYAEHVAQMGHMAVDTRDPQVLLDEVPVAAAAALQVEVCTVFLLEPSGLEFRVASGVGLLPGEARGDRVANRHDTPLGFVLGEGKPFVVDNYVNERRFAAPRAYLDAGLTSGLVVPLSDRGRTVGAIAVHSREAQAFGDDEVRFLESLSSLLATSLQRAQTEEQLGHSQRLESVGQLTGGIAHDFNNLLTVISGNLQVLEELPAIAGDAFGQQMVGAATRATKRAAELTGKLLAFSRRQVLQPSRVDVSALLHSLTDMLQRTLDQRIAITLDAAADCPPCLVDAGQLESALLNIAINARDAMPGRGTLAFSCRAAASVPMQLRAELPDASAGAYVAIAIADSGVGMSDAIKERAFEPFFTTKEAGRGTGLGLSTVYGFAKQSRGVVTLDSTLGVGTTVTLYLPRPGTPEVAPEADADTARRVPRGLNVLMVEDDAEVRTVMQRFLASLGCRVTACGTGEQALSLLDADAPFELLLTDIALGAGMRGTELAQAAQQRLPHLPVLLMTGFSSGLIETPPGWELLHKPCTRAELARAIAKALNP